MQKDGNHKKSLIIVLSLLFVVVAVLVIVNIAIVLKHNGKLGGGGIEDCLKLEDKKDVLNCINEEAFSYSYKDDCENALKVYNDIPVNQFDNNELITLYGQAYQISLSCDEESQDYWWGRYHEVLSQMEGRN